MPGLRRVKLLILSPRLDSAAHPRFLPGFAAHFCRGSVRKVSGELFLRPIRPRMQNSSSSRVPEESGTPGALRRPAQVLPIDRSAMPREERERPPAGGRRAMPVERDGKSGGNRRILSVGDDPHLLRTRHLVLESAGYEVQSVPGDAAAEADVLSTIDLAILCHSVEEHQAARVISSLRKVNPSLPIIRLTTAAVRQQSSRDEVAVSCAPDGPRRLLTQVHSMLTVFGKPATG